MKKVLTRLDVYWFGPALLRDLALFRIVLSSLQLVLLLWPSPPDTCVGCSIDHQIWLTNVDPRLYTPIPALKVLLFPLGWGVRPDVTVLQVAWLGAVFSGVGTILGWYTKASTLCFAATNTLLIAHSYSYKEMHHTEAIMIIALWLLFLSPSGAIWSVDDLKSRLHDSLHRMKFQPEATLARDRFAVWPLRLTQWLVALCYLSAGTSKLLNGGLDWFNGYTLAYYFAKDSLERGLSLGVFLAGHPNVLVPLAVLAVAFELSFTLTIFLPRVVWLYLLTGFAFHLGIYVVHGPPFFQFLALYVAFIEAGRAGSGATRKQEPKPLKWTLVYDGLCPRAIRALVVLDYCDVNGRLTYLDFEQERSKALNVVPALTPAHASGSLRLVSPSGQVFHGFFALRAMASFIPVLRPVGPILKTNIAGAIGSWTCKKMAARRKTASLSL
jgi:hypothetical protein